MGPPCFRGRRLPIVLGADDRGQGRRRGAAAHSDGRWRTWRVRSVGHSASGMADGGYAGVSFPVRARSTVSSCSVGAAVGAAHGTRATAVELLPGLGEPVSSSRIRAEIRGGHLELAAELLGRPLTIVGTVTDRDHEWCAVAVPPNLVRPCPGRYDGWLQPGAGSRHHRPALVIVGHRDNVDAVLLAGPTALDVRAGDRVRVGFIRAAAGPDDAVSIG
jgi:hypothetical protein